VPIAIAKQFILLFNSQTDFHFWRINIELWNVV